MPVPSDKQSASGNVEPGPRGSVPPALDCWYLTGPTAAGKTTVGLELARLLGTEVISLDSMAVYRGMDIGTAKPSREQLLAVPHHLINILDPDQEFSVSNYVEAAHQQIAELRTAGREVLFVGGTPMYLKALLRGMYQGPPADWQFRREVEEEARRVGIETLHARLGQVDPLSAAKLHQNDIRRIIRALEVYKITGEPISHQQMQFDQGVPAERCRVFVLGWSRSVLHLRIDARVEGMFSAGLIDEVRGLLAEFGALGRTAAQAVGYREAIAYLRGEMSLQETRRHVRVRTHQFARRQETWFRSLSECRRIEQDSSRGAMETAERLVELGRSAGP